MEPFQFKKFSLKHGLSPMQIGVDSMLLGAWTDVSNCKKVLDIGTGCGILSFMCAQSNENAHITGIDISDSAVLEANENRINSPWSNNIHFELGNLKNYVPKQRFDLIITNPPFFNKQSLQSPNSERAKARHMEELELEDIFKFTHEHLAPNGRLSMVLPFDEFQKVQQMTCKYKFRINRLATVKPKVEKDAHRILVEIGTDPNKLDVSELVIRDLDNTYTPEYQALTQDFYR